MIATNIKVSRSAKLADIATINSWSQDYCLKVLNAVKTVHMMPMAGFKTLPIGEVYKYLDIKQTLIHNVLMREPDLLNSDEVWFAKYFDILYASYLMKLRVSNRRGYSILYSDDAEFVLPLRGCRVFTPRAILKVAILLAVVCPIGVQVHDMIMEHRRYVSIVKSGLYDPLNEKVLEARKNGLMSLTRFEVPPIEISTEGLLATNARLVARSATVASAN